MTKACLQRSSHERGAVPWDVAASLIVVFATAPLAGCIEQQCRQVAPSSQAQRPERIVKEVGPIFVTAHKPSVVEGVFLVRNPSRAQSMALTLQRRSCSCTDFSIDPDVVAPGEEAKIVVRAHLPSLSQVHRFFMLFETNVSELPQFSVELVVRCFARLTILPSSLPVLNIRAGEEQTFTIEVVACDLIDDTPAPITVEDESGRLGLSVVRVDEWVDGLVRTRVAQCQGSIRYPTALTYPLEPFHDEVAAQCGDQTASQIVRWLPVQPIQVIPAKTLIHVGARTTSRLIELRAERAFAIVSAEDESGTIGTQVVTTGISTCHKIELFVDAVRIRGRGYICSVQIMTDHPDQPEVLVPIYMLNLGGHGQGVCGESPTTEHAGELGAKP